MRKFLREFSLFTQEIIVVEQFLRGAHNSSWLFIEIVLEALEARHQSRIEAVMAYSVLWDCTFEEAWLMIVKKKTPPCSTTMSDKELEVWKEKLSSADISTYLKY